MQHRKHRAFVRCFHIFIIFFTAKSFKNSFFKKQFFPATGDIFEMQPVDFMNGCDSNAEAVSAGSAQPIWVGKKHPI